MEPITYNDKTGPTMEGPFEAQPTEQRQEVEEMLAQLAAMEARARRTTQLIARKISENLSSCMQIDDEIFYPVMKKYSFDFSG